MKFRLSSLLALTGAVLAGTVLFWTSQKVQISEARLRQLKAAVASEENTIRVLKAEWAYLTRPDRLEQLAKTHLGMKPVMPDQVAADAGAIPAPAQPLLPGRKPSQVAQPVSAQVLSPAEDIKITQPVAPQAPEKTKPQVQRSFKSLLDDLAKKRAGQ